DEFRQYNPRGVWICGVVRVCLDRGQDVSRLCAAPRLRLICLVARRRRSARADRAGTGTLTNSCARKVSPGDPPQILDIGDDGYGRDQDAGILNSSALRGQRLLAVTPLNWPVLRNRHRYEGTTAAMARGSMPSASSVRPSRLASSETTASPRSNSTWSGVNSGLGVS